MEALHKASVNVTGLRESATQLADDVAELAKTKKFGMDRTARKALDSAASDLEAVNKHLARAATQLATADSAVTAQEQEQARLKRPPPG